RFVTQAIVPDYLAGGFEKQDPPYLSKNTKQLNILQTVVLISHVSQVRLKPDTTQEEIPATPLRRCGRYMVKPHGSLVPVSLTHYCASTPGLSTWSSTRSLQRDYSLGDLISWRVSRLDAFSVSPFRTSLLGTAAGATTDTLEVRHTRSSRTKVSPTQVSCAHHR